MEDFIFSLNCTMPVFLVMVLGFFLQRRGMLNQNFIDVCNKFVFQVTLPVMLFRDMATMDLRSQFDVRFVLFCAGGALFGILLAWLLSKIFVKDKSIVAEVAQGSYRGSIAVLGGAFLQNIYPGDEASGVVAQALIGSVILFNIFAVVILVLERPQEGDKLPLGPQLEKAFRQVATNPLILAILLGALSSLLRIQYPVIISKTMSSVASLTSPLALLAVGAEFKWGKMQSHLKPVLLACSYKLLIQPALILPVAVLLGFRNEWLVTLMIMMGAPTTPSSFVMARSMGHEGSTTANIIAGTTLFSAVSVTLWLFLGRSLGLLR